MEYGMEIKRLYINNKSGLIDVVSTRNAKRQR